MHMLHKGLLGSCLLLVGTAAVGGLNGVDVIITNDGTEDVVVTVYDTSIQPNGIVLQHERINGFTRVPVSLSMDESGRANIEWMAVSADPQLHRCGHESSRGLTDSASVKVRVDSECGST